MLATMSDAHSEWHRNAGVPMGQPGCPQDACHDDVDWAHEEWLVESEAQAPALREGESPAAPLPYFFYGCEPAPPVPSPWDIDPPF